MHNKTEVAEASFSESSSDEQLWLSIKKGNKKAFNLLFLRHHDDLFRYASKMCNTRLAEDCLQDIFIKLWESHSTLNDVSGVKTYLWRMLRNNIISKLRKKNRRLRLLDLAKPDIKPGLVLNAEDLAIASEISEENQNKLDQAMALLSARQREVIYLKFYDGMNYQEIEQIMGISYQTARNYICKALKALKQHVPAVTQNDTN